MASSIPKKRTSAVIHRGVECMAAETCYPVKVAHGHILDLLQAGVMDIFLPSIIDMRHPHPEIEQGLVCPLAQTLSYTVPGTIDFSSSGARLHTPVIYFGRGRRLLRRSLQTWGKS